MGNSRWAGWASDDQEREGIEQRLRDLVGRTIEAVRYVEVPLDDPEPMWAAGKFDSLDFGLELDLDGAVTWSAIWKQQGPNLALLVYPAPLVPNELSLGAWTSTWDVTDRWHDRGVRTIAAITPVWTRFEFSPAFDRAGRMVLDGGHSDLCMQTLIVTASSGSEAIITLGMDVGGGEFRIADGIAVFFDRSEAQEAGVLMVSDA
jgi:hypothetical protein